MELRDEAVVLIRLSLPCDSPSDVILQVVFIPEVHTCHRDVSQDVVGGIIDRHETRFFEGGGQRHSVT